MANETGKNGMNRRDFLRDSALAAGASALTASWTSHATETPDDGLDHRNERPDRMRYQKLGRTNFMCSRLIFGGGAALSGGRAVRLLDHAFEAGINLYDLGSNAYYKQAENHFADFYKRHRGDIFVVSKAPVRIRVRRGEDVTVEQAKDAAQQWSNLLDRSLKDMQTDFIDAYYIMMVDQPTLVKSDEMHRAFTRAKDAGKVAHFGISTHLRAEACLEAAIGAGFYDLAMIAVTPAGWYSPNMGGLLKDTPRLTGLRPLLDRARAAGIGLVGMKAARAISPARPGMDSNTSLFDDYYPAKLREASLSPYQRAYAYVLENGLDVVNADMQNLKHFEENVVAARESNTYFA